MRKRRLVLGFWSIVSWVDGICEDIVDWVIGEEGEGINEVHEAMEIVDPIVEVTCS